MSKLNTSIVEQEVRSKGFILLFPFIKSSIPITVLCKNDHTWNVLISNFRRRTCPDCKGVKNKKYTYDQIKEYIEGQGYKLISTEYMGVFEKLILECPFGHEYIVNFHNFKQSGHRCVECSGYKKKDIDLIRSFIESHREFCYK